MKTQLVRTIGGGSKGPQASRSLRSLNHHQRVSIAATLQQCCAEEEEEEEGGKKKDRRD